MARAAHCADQKHATMGFSRVGAADESIHPLDAVNQPVFDQEIDRAVHRRRSRAKFILMRTVEQRIGAARPVID